MAEKPSDEKRVTVHTAQLEEEMFLTAQLFEESKHVEWFDRFVNRFISAKLCA